MPSNGSLQMSSYHMLTEYLNWGGNAFRSDAEFTFVLESLVHVDHTWNLKSVMDWHNEVPQQISLHQQA